MNQHILRKLGYGGLTLCYTQIFNYVEGPHRHCSRVNFKSRVKTRFHKAGFTQETSQDVGCPVGLERSLDESKQRQISGDEPGGEEVVEFRDYLICLISIWGGTLKH